MAAPAAAEYQTVDVRLLNITIDTDWAPRAAPGYVPARFEITNTGDARIIEIVGQGMRAYRGPRMSAGTSNTTVTQTLRLAMGDHVRLTIPVPVYADTETVRFEIRERNRPTHFFNFNAIQSRVAAKDASILVVAVPGSPASAIPLRAIGGARYAGIAVARGSGAPAAALPSAAAPIRTVAGGTLDFQLEPARLPTNWLGYTSVRGVVLGPQEWQELTQAQKSALLTWAAAGGDLFFVDGEIRTLLPAAAVDPADAADRTIARHLFGRVYGIASASLSAGLADLLTATEANRDQSVALPVNSAADWGTIERRGFRLRIPGIEGVPTRVYLGILLLFSLVIGPLNYWILWRRRQQVLMVITVPVISAVFILLLGGYAIAGEGFRVKGRAVTFTLLDQAAKQAATRATGTLYAAGILPSGGVTFGREAAVWAVGTDGSGVRERMEVDLTDAQQFSAGVLQARSPTNFDQVVVRPARERLTFADAGGVMSVTNGLEADILSLVYRDGDAVYRLDKPLAAGGKQAMTRTAATASLPLPSGLGIPGKLLGVFQTQPSGSYLAVLDRSPFWEPGVPRLAEFGSAHVVLGWPEGQP
jgi:hypothetical protein